MLKKLAVPVLILAVVGLIAYFIIKPEPEPDSGVYRAAATNSTEQGGKEGSAASTEGIDLLLKTMEITQGEKGLKLWRLQTNWANLRKEDGIIVATKPKLTYYMPPDDKELTVTSDTGDVNQAEGILRFVTNVNATFEGRSVTGPLLVYNGTNKTMTFPDGGNFEGGGITGKAKKVVWRMDKNIIEAQSGVQVDFDGAGQGRGEQQNSPADDAQPQEQP